MQQDNSLHKNRGREGQNKEGGKGRRTVGPAQGSSEKKRPANSCLTEKQQAQIRAYNGGALCGVPGEDRNLRNRILNNRKVRNKHEEIIMARREKRRVKRKEKKGNLKL